MAVNSKITPVWQVILLIAVVIAINIFNSTGYNWLLKSGYIGWAIFSLIGTFVVSIYCFYKLYKIFRSWQNADRS
jgi:uncharacterized membrane protein